jgi:hypothetical protein
LDVFGGVGLVECMMRRGDWECGWCVNQAHRCKDGSTPHPPHAHIATRTLLLDATAVYAATLNDILLEGSE